MSATDSPQKSTPRQGAALRGGHRPGPARRPPVPRPRRLRARLAARPLPLLRPRGLRGGRVGRDVPGEQAPPRGEPGGGAHGRAHRPRQPPPADRGPGARFRGGPSSRTSSRCSTSTASRPTTTASVTPRATRCCAGSRRTSAARSRPTASAYRLGGDEFCILAAGRGRGRRADRARLRRRFGARGPDSRCAAPGATCPFPGRTVDAVEAMRLADRRMYVAEEPPAALPERQTRNVLLRALQER